MMFGQDQKPAIVGAQLQTILMVAKIPADPGVARGTLPGAAEKLSSASHWPCQVATYHSESPIFGNAPRS